MNVIVTGATGLLGRAVVAEFELKSWKVLGLADTKVHGDLMKIDLTDFDAVSRIVYEFKPHVIVHCTDEKSPEKIEINPGRYTRLNVDVPGELAKLAGEIKAVFLFITSDYVFPGVNPPYREFGRRAPVNKYGRSKVDAEKIVTRYNPGSLILRIPVIYGGEENIEESAVSAVAHAVKRGLRTKMSNSEIKFPSHTKDIAGISYDLVQRKLQDPAFKGNTFHWCESEPLTKYEMARMIAEKFGQPHDHLIPMNVAAPGTPRPKNCQMSCTRLETLGITRNTRFVDGIEDFRKFFE